MKARNMTPVLWETTKLLAAGRTNRQIADALGCSVVAANDRARRVLSYFALTNRTALVAHCYRERIV